MATIYGKQNTAVYGSSDSDNLYADYGSSTLIGAGGNDVFYTQRVTGSGSLDVSTLIGNTGNDTFYVLRGPGAKVTTGTGMDKVIFGGTQDQGVIVSKGFTITDFDANKDRLLVEANFPRVLPTNMPVMHGNSSSTLLEISAAGKISADSVFVKIQDSFLYPDDRAYVASKLFLLDTSTVSFPDRVLLIVGNSNQTVIWQFLSDNKPTMRSDELYYLGTLSSLPIQNFTNGVITYLSEYQEPTVAPVSTGATGTAGNDLFTSSFGNDLFDGSSGTDTVVFSGTRSNYTLSKTSTGWKVSSTSQGVDSLSNIERLKFPDKTVALDIDGNAGEVYRLYQAAFNRTPDKGGLGDWIYGMDTGMSLLDVSAGFINSNEFKSVYGANPTNSEVVTRFYQNVLHRAPEQAGYDYWMNQLNSGAQTRTQVLTGFSESNENQVQVIGVIQNGIEYTQHQV